METVKLVPESHRWIFFWSQVVTSAEMISPEDRLQVLPSPCGHLFSAAPVDLTEAEAHAEMADLLRDPEQCRAGGLVYVQYARLFCWVLLCHLAADIGKSCQEFLAEGEAHDYDIWVRILAAYDLAPDEGKFLLMVHLVATMGLSEAVARGHGNA